MPQLLTLSTPLLRTRTLVHRTSAHPIAWDTVVTSLALADQAIGIVLITASTDDLPRLYDCAKRATLVLLSEAVWSLKPPAYWEDNFDNLLLLEQVHELYPFLSPWLGSESDAVALFALILRYDRLVTPLKVGRVVAPMTVVAALDPPVIWLVTQYFRTEDVRQAELRACLATNLPFFNRVVLLNERDFSREWRDMEGHEKIVQIVTKKRLTYAHFLQFVHDEVPSNVMVVLANADIFFDPLHDLLTLDLQEKALALLRWDVTGTSQEERDAAVMFGPRADSQDAWILLSDSVKTKSIPYARFDFPLGKAGCDNAFAAHLLRQHFSLFNPSLTVKSYHLHTSGIRTYSKEDAIRSDLYVNLVPTRLIATKQVDVPSHATISYVCHESVAFEVKSSSLSNEMTYCAMLEKDGRYKWEATVENYFFEPAISVYTTQGGMGVTANGLMFRPYEIVVGKDVGKGDAKIVAPYGSWWEHAAVDIMRPLPRMEKMLALPFENTGVFEDRERYLVEYLSWVARLRKEHSSLGFWVPAALWKEVTAMPIGDAVPVPYEDNSSTVWADEVVGLLPGPHEMGHEEIQALREWHPTWVKDGERSCVVVIDGAITPAFVAERVAPWLAAKGWAVRLVGEAGWEGAGMAILQSERMYPLWRLPVDAMVIEFQQELAIHGEMQHVCHVSDLRSWVLLLAKGGLKDVQDQIMEQLEKWCKKNEREIKKTF